MPHASAFGAASEFQRNGRSRSYEVSWTEMKVRAREAQAVAETEHLSALSGESSVDIFGD